MGAEKYDLLSVRDYLAAEAASEVKHEYLAGVVYAMSAAGSGDPAFGDLRGR